MRCGTGFSIEVGTFADVLFSMKVSQGEGMNKCLRDAVVLHTAAPSTLFVGKMHGRTVSSLAVVVFSSAYATSGLYMVCDSV